MSIKPQRFWYLKSYDTIMNFPVHWTLSSLSHLSVYYSWNLLWDDTLGAFRWGDLGHDQWSKITRMVHQRNQWIRDQRGFISSIYEPWWILIQLTPKKCTLYLYWTLLNKTSWPDKIVNLIGLKIISNVNKHYSAYDSLKYFLTVFWYCYASVFFPKFFHLQPHSHLPQLNFSVFLY